MLEGNSFDTELILNNDFATFSKVGDGPKKIIKSINKNYSRDHYYSFANPGEGFNYGCVRDPDWPNQRILEGGNAGDSIYYYLYEMYSSARYGNYCLVIQKKTDSIFYWDFATSPKVKSLDALQRFMQQNPTPLK